MYDIYLGETIVINDVGSLVLPECWACDDSTGDSSSAINDKTVRQNEYLPKKVSVEMVLAGDGQIYELSFINDWIDNLRKNSQPIISPTFHQQSMTSAYTTVDPCLYSVYLDKLDACVKDFASPERKIRPVVTDDGCMYSEDVILAYFGAAGLLKIGLIKSPARPTFLLTTLKFERIPDEDVEIYDRARDKLLAGYSAMSSIQDIGQCFKETDYSQDVLAQPLSDWTRIPYIIVFGGQKVPIAYI